MRHFFLAIILLLCLSCKENGGSTVPSQTFTDTTRDLTQQVESASLIEEADTAVILIWESDSSFERNDTTWIYNSKLDTTVIITGFFNDLSSEFYLYNSEPVQYVREAMKFEKASNFEAAKEQYLKVVNYDLSFLEGPECCDLNSYYQIQVNTAMLVSYAYEKLGQPDSAINVLKPWMANGYEYYANIYKHYITLNIAKHGFKRVRAEFDNAANTLKRKENPYPYDFQWTVSIFGAPFLVGGRNEDNITIEEAMHNLTSDRRYCHLLGY